MREISHVRGKGRYERATFSRLPGILKAFVQVNRSYKSAIVQGSCTSRAIFHYRQPPLHGME